MHLAFPQTRSFAVDFRWSGFVAMTLDFLPFAGRLGPRTFYSMGYNGTGVAMATLMGRYLAAIIRGEHPWLPLISRPLRAIPFHAFRAPAVRLVTGAYELLDRLGY